jgi:hypothetical protein
MSALAAASPVAAGGHGALRAPGPGPLVPLGVPGTNQPSESENWSGYQQAAYNDGESPTTFTAITGEWTVPTATQEVADQAEASATWIGIGGGCLNATCSGKNGVDSTLVQAGTEEDVPKSGPATYDAWYELIPQSETAVMTVTVHPGDVITCSISLSDTNTWTIQLQDVSDAQGFTENVSYHSGEDTAEWIEEAPSQGNNILPFPDVGTVQFSEATVDGANADLAADQEVQMVSKSDTIEATPSGPNAAADGFNDCSYATSCAAPGGTTAPVTVRTATKLRTSANPTRARKDVTFTAKVKPQSGPSVSGGTVRFMMGGSPLTGCKKVPVASGVARCTHDFPSKGHKAITAAYSGATGLAASTSGTLLERVKKG